MVITVTDKKTGKPQAFEIRMVNMPLIQTFQLVERSGYHPDKAYLDPLRENIKRIRESSYSSLKIMPLTEEGAKHGQFKRSNFHYRGGKKYLGVDKEELDANPFIIRGKAIGMVSAYAFISPDTNQLTIRFTTEDSNTITAKQADELVERFGEEIIKALPVCLDTVRQETIDFMVSYAGEGIQEMIERLEDLKSYLSSLS